jgi:hypothetical protein
MGERSNSERDSISVADRFFSPLLSFSEVGLSWDTLLQRHPFAQFDN